MDRLLARLAGAAAMVALTLLAACSALGSGHALDGTDWRLVGWTVSSIDPAQHTITAVFENGTVGGTSAVNSYGAEYSTGARGSFEVGEISQTLMAGDEESMRAESAYTQLLAGAASYRVEGDTLTLFDENSNESLIFEAVRR